MTTAHDFEQPTIDHEPCSLSAYAGKVALVVNVASKCGLTPQYTWLERLHRELADRDFVVLGFPCNQFNEQEPGTEEEIKTFCSTGYGVTFPMFSKIEVNGPNAHPMYRWLTGLDLQPEGAGDVQWNFGKFLIGRDGAALARFSPRTDPNDPALREAIEKALG